VWAAADDSMQASYVNGPAPGLLALGTGITEIAFNASSYQFTGYVPNRAETVITKEITVSGPGSTTPVVRHPKSAPLPPAGR
jgi:hypothetical protein